MDDEVTRAMDLLRAREDMATELERARATVLAGIRAKAEELRAAQVRVDELLDERDELILAAMRTDIPRVEIAKAAEVAKVTLYAIAKNPRGL